MFDIILLLILVVLVFTAVYFPLAGRRNAKVAYIAVAWLPSALLLLMYICNRTLDYGLIFLGLLVAASSLMLGAVGVILLVRASGRGESRLIVLVFTLTAFVPAAVFLMLLLGVIGAA